MQGKTINGYTLQRRLGIGGMAEVWYAENKIGKSAAVKILSENLFNNENIVNRFRVEAQIMVKLNHPNIRQVYDFDAIDGRPAIIMEYLDGDDLKARMKQGQRFTEAEIEKWWNQLVDALNYTHANGIIHRDIKPGNIFVDRNGDIKLLDFGIAKLRENITTTQTGQKLGTLMYMSPEQVKDSKHIDHQTDAYSLAVSFVHIITGKRPYDSDTSSDFEISEQIVYKPLDLSGLPEKWRNFLEPYLDKDPQKRPKLQHFEMKQAAVKPVTNVDDEATISESGETEKVEIREKKDKEEKKDKKDKEEKEEKEEKKEGKKKSKLWIVVAGVAIAAVVAVVVLLNNNGSNDEKATEAAKAVPVKWTSEVARMPEYADPELYPILNRSDNNELKVGYIDKTGKVIVEPKYCINNYYFDGKFSEGMMTVFDCESNKYGVIDAQGNEITDFIYDEIRAFQEGMAAVRIGDENSGKWGFIDKTGKVVVKPKYDVVNDFKEGMGPVKSNKKYGFVDKNGIESISLKYENVSNFKDGIAYVRVGNHSGYIDKTGEEYIFYNYDFPYIYFSEGLGKVSINGKYGYINNSGEIVIEPKYDLALDFLDGVAFVEINNKWGFIDKTGKMLAKPQYTGWTNRASEGFIRVSIDSKWGYVDNTGKRVIALQYDIARDFSDGVAVVGFRDEDDSASEYAKSYRYGVIDKSGKQLTEFKYKSISDFTNGVAVVRSLDGGAGLIDKTGKELLEPIYGEIQTFDSGIVIAGKRIDNVVEWWYYNLRGELIYNYHIVF